ncbi:MAG: general secretion pathway protein GspB [Woeseiaceae bacterium]
MSFILDALKKSETERQQQGSAEFSTIPSSTPQRDTPRWLWVLIALLAINMIVLLLLVLRPAKPAATVQETVATTPATVQPAPEQVSPAASGTSFDERVAAAKADRDAAPVAPPTARESAPVQSVQPRQSSNDTTMVLPSALELRANGEMELPDMHVDIHVYSEVPAERFVFINMDKHREGSTLDEGPTVREITVDGVVLEYRGRRFTLPRE